MKDGKLTRRDFITQGVRGILGAALGALGGYLLLRGKSDPHAGRQCRPGSWCRSCTERLICTPYNSRRGTSLGSRRRTAAPIRQECEARHGKKS